MSAKKTLTQRIGISIVDDHPIIREGIRRLVEQEPDMWICQSCGSAAELDLASGNKPDLLIVDISMPGRSGLEIIKDVAAGYPGIRKLVVSVHDESTYIERSLQAGADGYVCKQEAPDVIIVAIRAVMSGQSYISPSLLSTALRLIGGKPRREHDERVSALSDRELEVLEQIGRGLSTSEIAGNLNLSVNTIATHRRHIIEKLNIPGQRLVKFAVEWISGMGHG